MKTYYYYLRDLDSLDANQVIYKVSVGQSQREQIKKALLENYALDTNGFFRLVDVDSDYFLEEKAAQIFHNRKYGILLFRSATISISDIYEHIIDDTLNFFESNLAEPSAKRRLLCSLFPDFRPISFAPAKEKSCQPVQRKNLSNGQAYETISACFGLAIVSALVLFGMVLDSLERYFY